MTSGAESPTLERWLKARPAWQDGLLLVLDWSRRLAEFETSGTFPGALLPNDRLQVGPDGKLEILAVETEFGLERAHLPYLPPEQATGRAWDHAANRYVLGLVLYEVCAGEAAYAGLGFRLSLEERLARPPAPFSHDRAAVLPPGLQSLALRSLDPDPARRPTSAAAIALEIEGFLDQHKPNPARKLAGPSHSESASRGSAPPARAVSRPRLVAFRPVMLALGAALLLLLALAIAVGPSRGPRAAGFDRRPLSSAAKAADCAGCHPRHFAEWSDSVMAHAGTSPLFQALEMLIEERVAQSSDCPNGAGILRAAGRDACRDSRTGQLVTGSGSEGWCSNCHTPSVRVRAVPEPFQAQSPSDASRLPLLDLIPTAASEGISCLICHEAVAPARSRGGAAIQSRNAFWTSTESGTRFDFRPEARRGLLGIANAGFELDPSSLLTSVDRARFAAVAQSGELVEGGAHRKVSAVERRYQSSSEFCGSCHDVRLFGTDVLGASRGEHFKRLRNAYSEWKDFAAAEARAGRRAPECIDCHLSSFPADAPGTLPLGRIATTSDADAPYHPHYFTGIELPLDPRFTLAQDLAGARDRADTPLDPRARRDLLLARAVTLSLGSVERQGRRLVVPVTVENVGAGHRVPAGFSQERELWVELEVFDARGGLVYSVGHVARADEDLHDKVFSRVNVDDALLDSGGHPLGLFGADVTDGPDVPEWSPPPARGGTSFRGRGLINFQNGFLRCVRCIGVVDAQGRCQASGNQSNFRAERFADADYDPDTGTCNSNLSGEGALFETYFPVGALDASRGILKAPDAIIDTRSLPPNVPIAYRYELDVGRRAGPFRVTVRLMFRAFPPYLVRAFVEYEKQQARRGKRPSGALIDARALDRLELVEIARSARDGGDAS